MQPGISVHTIIISDSQPWFVCSCHAGKKKKASGTAPPPSPAVTAARTAAVIAAANAAAAATGGYEQSGIEVMCGAFRGTFVFSSHLIACHCVMCKLPATWTCWTPIGYESHAGEVVLVVSVLVCVCGGGGGSTPVRAGDKCMHIESNLCLHGAIASGTL